MAKKLAMVLGIIFIILGLVGFLTNPLVGPAGALFPANPLHNLIHLITGIIGVWVAAKSMSGTMMYLKIFGIIYLLVAILGFAMGSPILGLVDTNMADNLLHLIVALLFIWAGFWGGKSGASA